MIAEAVIVRDSRILMVKQHVERGAIVWNFPGGGVEGNETAEQACVREAKEETGYDISITKLLSENEGKYTYLAEIIGGDLFLDTTNKSNQDIIEVAWIRPDDCERFDAVTAHILNLLPNTTRNDVL
jgi:ADP-ribose pyrophosphatase YjhB (NUDIX family)